MKFLKDYDFQLNYRLGR